MSDNTELVKWLRNDCECDVLSKTAKQWGKEGVGPCNRCRAADAIEALEARDADEWRVEMDAEPMTSCPKCADAGLRDLYALHRGSLGDPRTIPHFDDLAAVVTQLTAAQRRLVEMRWALRNMRTAAICFEAVAPEDDAIQDIREELVEAFVQSSALAARPAAPAQEDDLIEWLLDADKLMHISHAELIAGCKRAADALASVQSGFSAGIEAAARLLDEATDRCLANEAEHYGRHDGALATVWKAKARILEQQAAAIRALKRGEG